MTIVFMFPGQSSRSPQMLERIISAWPQAASLVRRASEVVGRDLRRHYQLAPEQAFATNRDVQVGVFLASYLHQQALAAHGIVGDRSLGLSLGEYNHLVHTGAIAFEDALRLVDTRGRLYDAGPDGMMASIFPLSLEELAPYVAAARAHGVLEIANLNSPSQHVIAGERAAVEAAVARIEDEEIGVRAVVIEQRIPMHTSVFASVGNQFRPYLDRAPWRTPNRPYLPNVLGRAVAAGRHEMALLLERHVSSPVLWQQSIECVAAAHQDACFVEVGPGAVLFNLLQKQWGPYRRLKTDDLQDPAGQLARVIAELAPSVRRAA